MIRPILSAISDTLWTVTYLYAEQRARLARERRDAEMRAQSFRDDRDLARAARDDYRVLLTAAIDERDAARSAHASLLADIRQACALAMCRPGAGPVEIVETLIRRSVARGDECNALRAEAAQLRIDLARALNEVDDARRGHA